MARTVARSEARGVPVASRLVWEPVEGRLARRPDSLAVEEPLEIRLGSPPEGKSPGSGSSSRGRAEPAPQVLNVTMRTPGSDFELAAGWLLSEGVVREPGDLLSVRYCTDPAIDKEQRYNVVTADLSGPALARLSAAGGAAPRLAVTSSSCGVCGSSSIEALSSRGHRKVSSRGSFRLEDVLGWPERLRSEGQKGFDATGGLHAAALISREGELLAAREDIGRHNAVDKVIGWAFLEAVAGHATLPLEDAGLVVSGRTSFEIVQKALVAGVPVVAAVSAASSLAARLASEHGMTLVGFVREGRCTVYSEPDRLALG